jgi:hypothetical protein
MQQAQRKVWEDLERPELAAATDASLASPGNGAAAAAAAVDAATQAALAAAQQERQQVALRLASLMCSCLKAIAREEQQQQQQQQAGWQWVAASCSSMIWACSNVADLEAAVRTAEQRRQTEAAVQLRDKWLHVCKGRVPLPGSLVMMLQHVYGSQFVEFLNVVVLKLAADYSCQLKGETLPARIEPQHLSPGVRKLAAMLAYSPCMQGSSSGSSSSRAAVGTSQPADSSGTTSSSGKTSSSGSSGVDTASSSRAAAGTSQPEDSSKTTSSSGGSGSGSGSSGVDTASSSSSQVAAGNSQPADIGETTSSGSSSSGSSSSSCADLSGAELEVQLACAAVIARAVRLYSTVLQEAFAHPCLDEAASAEARAAGAAQLMQQVSIADRYEVLGPLPNELLQQLNSGDVSPLDTADSAAGVVGALLGEQGQMLEDVRRGVDWLSGQLVRLGRSLQLPQDTVQQLQELTGFMQATMGYAMRCWYTFQEQMEELEDVLESPAHAADGSGGAGASSSKTSKKSDAENEEISRQRRVICNSRANWVYTGHQSFGESLYQVMQSWAEAVCAALPSRRCCSNPCCVVLREMSESNLVNGKACCCGGCSAADQAVRYCSRDCQASHWQQHKALCRGQDEAAAAAGTRAVAVTVSRLLPPLTRRCATAAGTARQQHMFLIQGAVQDQEEAAAAGAGQ